MNSKKINKIYIQLQTCTSIIYEAISYRFTSQFLVYSETCVINNKNNNKKKVLFTNAYVT